MDARLGDGEAAARLGHLLLHLIDGEPLDLAGTGTCSEKVARALDAEATALATELRLRRALGVDAPVVRFEMESAFWAAPEAERTTLVRGYFDTHPDGAPGVRPLARLYTSRCERESAP